MILEIQKKQGLDISRTLEITIFRFYVKSTCAYTEVESKNHMHRPLEFHVVQLSSKMDQQTL